MYKVGSYFYETPKSASQVKAARETEPAPETQVGQDLRDPHVFPYAFLPVSLILSNLLYFSFAQKYQVDR